MHRSTVRQVMRLDGVTDSLKPEIEPIKRPQAARLEQRELTM
jgi:hypothetical protein